MAKFYDAEGALREVEVSLDTIREAGNNNMSVRDYVNTVYQTNAEAYGDAFSQFCASEGIVLVPQKRSGIRAPSLDAALNGRPTLEAGAIVRQPSQQARTLLMPAIGALVEDKLLGDFETNAMVFDKMIALDDTITDEWLLWPEANYAGPEAGRSQGVAQLAKPNTMLTLTTSERQIKVPTYALGIEWSEQATKYLNLDFISLSIARQVLVERNERAGQNILAMLNGDVDVGQSALSAISGKVKTALSLDSTATAGLTQKAWMLWLYGAANRRIDYVITDILGALAIENRVGKPIVTNDDGTSPRINSTAVVANPAWNSEVQVFIMPQNSGWPANTIMGVDSRFAMHRVTSTNASYQAQEDFVLRRGSAMRFDYGSLTRRLYDDAFDVLTFA